MNEEVKTTYGLVGFPISHSLSPLMHNRAFEELQVDAVYELFELKEEELENFFSDLKEDSSCIERARYPSTQSLTLAIKKIAVAAILDQLKGR